MNGRPQRVVKIGGSLLTSVAWPGPVQQWLSQQSGTSLLLAGGGELADVVRDWDRRWRLGQLLCHELCLELLPVAARLLARLLPSAPLVDNRAAIRRVAGESSSWVLDPLPFLRTEEPFASGCVLPTSWNTTSDSIAARVAEVWQIPELVLLKSAVPPAPTWAELAAAGYVDEFFPTAVRSLARVRVVALSGERIAEFAPH